MDLEKERLKIQYKRVKMAKDEMEFKILEREAEIQRIKENISNQDRTLKEIEAKLQE
jgi:hypothetical protein